jgi:hypothetical protein
LEGGVGTELLVLGQEDCSDVVEGESDGVVLLRDATWIYNEFRV